MPAPSAGKPSASGAIAAVAFLHGAVESLAVFQQRGMTFSEWLFLSTLRHNPALKTGGIARRLGLTPQRATQIVKALRTGGFLEVSQSATDPRKKDLRITPAGDKAIARIEADIGQRLAPAIATRPNALATLQKLSAALSKALAPAG